MPDNSEGMVFIDRPGDDGHVATLAKFRGSHFFWDNQQRTSNMESIFAGGKNSLGSDTNSVMRCRSGSFGSRRITCSRTVQIYQFEERYDLPKISGLRVLRVDS